VPYILYLRLNILDINPESIDYYIQLCILTFYLSELYHLLDCLGMQRFQTLLRMVVETFLLVVRTSSRSGTHWIPPWVSSLDHHVWIGHFMGRFTIDSTWEALRDTRPKNTMHYLL
jgi:hypothetical protein